MKKLIACLFGLILSMPAFATTCNLYNKANGVLYGYPSNNYKWVKKDSGTAELSIMMHLTEGQVYTAVRVAGANIVFRIQASATETLTHGQSLVNIDAGTNGDRYTFTVPTGAPYVIFYVRNSYSATPGANTSTLTIDDVINGFMVVEGSTAPTEYIPYDANCGLCPSGQVLQTYTSATGTVTQNGTPTPTNPIEPVFYKQGDMILRKINDTYADSYDATTGKITRRVGVKVLDGTENWASSTKAADRYRYYISVSDMINTSSESDIVVLSNYFAGGYTIQSLNKDYTNVSEACTMYQGSVWFYTSYNSMSKFINFLKQQYAAEAPVTIWYPLATAVEEDWNETTYCATNIKIATTAYNSARFSPVVTELNDTIATIRSVVTNTINQTKAIADLQATKQTRPNENCPAGKKCLLVEDNDGTPHWYEIIESPEVQ